MNLRLISPALTTAIGLGLGFVSISAAPVLGASMLVLSETSPGNMCSDDGEYCTRLSGNQIIVSQDSTKRSATIAELPIRQSETLEPIGFMIELSPGHLLVGVRFVDSRAISGGSFLRRDLVMWDVRMADGTSLGPLLDIPASSLVVIENDCRGRSESAQPCRAEYSYGGMIQVLEAETSGYPALAIRTTATMAPNGASREFGWEEPASIASGDSGLDTDCSFQRAFNYNPLSASYVLDQALPECDAYLSPELLPQSADPVIKEMWMRDATPAELATFFPDQPGLAEQRRTNSALRIELGWLYNEMYSGSDVVVMRLSDNGRCPGGSCDLYLFGVNNCIEPAQCTPKWSQHLTGNRIYHVDKPSGQLNPSCPDSTFVIPSGPARGQYCIENREVLPVGDLPEGLARAFPQD